jgi:hypothetical protein
MPRRPNPSRGGREAASSRAGRTRTARAARSTQCATPFLPAFSLNSIYSMAMQPELQIAGPAVPVVYCVASVLRVLLSPTACAPYMLHRRRWRLWGTARGGKTIPTPAGNTHIWRTCFRRSLFNYRDPCSGVYFYSIPLYPAVSASSCCFALYPAVSRCIPQYPAVSPKSTHIPSYLGTG